MHKKQLVTEFVETVEPANVWDLGANIGLFSRIVSDRGIQVISFDSDPTAVEKNYLELKERNEENILPLLIDLANPSSGIGWECKGKNTALCRIGNKEERERRPTVSSSKRGKYL